MNSRAAYTLQEAALLCAGIDLDRLEDPTVKALFGDETSMPAIWFQRIRHDLKSWRLRASPLAGPNGEKMIRADQLRDWLVRCFPEEAAATRLVPTTEGTSAPVNLKVENEKLKAKIRDLDSQVKTLKADKIATQGRAGALSLILGMAMIKYGYHPAESNADAFKKITQGLNGLGLKITEATPIYWLKTAWESMSDETKAEILNSSREF